MNTINVESNNPILSVIMPAYNMEKWLDRAICSVTASSLKEIELIVVDDCSTDRTSEICDEWAKKDPRVRPVHLEKNGGSGPARNAGIAVSKGKYIGFADADDYVHPLIYQVLVETAQKSNARIAMCPYVRIDPDAPDAHPVSVDKQTCEIQNISRNQVFEKYFDYLLYHVTWNKVYDRKIVETEPFRALKQSQDMFWNFYMYEKADFVAFADYPEPLYYWVQRPDSASRHKFNEASVHNLVMRYEMLNHAYEKNLPYLPTVIKRVITRELRGLSESKEGGKEYSDRIKQAYRDNKKQVGKILRENRDISLPKKAVYTVFWNCPFTYNFGRNTSIAFHNLKNKLKNNKNI